MIPYPVYDIAISRSKIARQYLIVLLGVIALLCFFILLALDVPMHIGGVAALCILGGCLLIVLRSEREPSRLLINELGVCELRVSSRLFGQLTNDSIALPVCVIIYLQLKTQPRVYRFVLWQDMVDDISYRRLCRIVRIKRRQI
ncbi:MAG: hypothetical protein HRU25_16740 [Psychrobium sp.]|nr:hypothetical protein [Psychrobium sp.]